MWRPNEEKPSHCMNTCARSCACTCCTRALYTCAFLCPCPYPIHIHVHVHVHVTCPCHMYAMLCMCDEASLPRRRRAACAACHRVGRQRRGSKLQVTISYRGQPLAAVAHCARSALARLANLDQSPTPGSHNLAYRRPCLCAHRLDAVGPRPIGLKKPKSDINQLLWSAMPQSYMLMRDAHEGAGRPSRVPAPGYLCARDNKYSNYTATL